MSKRLEESLTDSVVTGADVGKIVKQQFTALVHGQFVERVSPCGTEADLDRSTEEVGGVRTNTAENRFILPFNVEGEANCF